MPQIKRDLSFCAEFENDRSTISSFEHTQHTNRQHSVYERSGKMN